MRSQAIDDIDSGATSASVLRAAFDRAFAEPPALERGRPIDLLSIRLGGDPFAIRLADTAGLFSDRKITPVPTTVAEFRGVSGFRGVLVPVYDLGALLGYAPSHSGRWLILTREVRAALVFDAFEGQLRVDPDGLLSHEGARGNTREVIREGDVSRPVIHLPAVIAAIRSGMRADRHQEEAAP